MSKPYILEATWSGYRAGQGKICHRERVTQTQAEKYNEKRKAGKMKSQTILDPTFMSAFKVAYSIPRPSEIQEMETITTGLAFYRKQLSTLRAEYLDAETPEEKETISMMARITELSVGFFDKSLKKYKDAYPEFDWASLSDSSDPSHH